MGDELSAINILLVARGITPILVINSGHPDVQAARLLLDVHKSAVNSVKRWYNTEVATLTPTVDGYIMLPAYVESLDNDQGNLIMDGKLYNVEERTNIYTDPVEDIVLIFNREIDTMPSQAFSYIVALAKEEFIRPLESSILSGQAGKDINSAKALLDIAEYRYNDTGKQSGNPLMLKWRSKMLVR